MKYVTAILMVLLMAVFTFGQTITIDGDMSDWTEDMKIDVAPNNVEEEGDISDINIDIKDIYVTHDADSLYFRYVINENATFSAIRDTNTYPSGGGFEINIDVDCDTSTGLNWGWWYTSSDYYLDITHPYAENEPIEWELWKFTGANGSDWSYEPTGIACHLAYNLDDNEVEFSIPRAEIGETNGEFESTAFFAYASIWADPWPEDIAPNDIGESRYVYRYGRKQITIDGDMSDWTDATKFDVSPNAEEGLGDSIDVDWDGTLDGIINPALDTENMYVCHDDNYLYVRIDINENGTFTDLQSMVDGGYQASIELFLDTDVDTSTGLTWGWWYTSGDYWINLSVPYGWPDFQLTQKYGIMKFIGSSGTDSQWEEVIGDSCLVAFNMDDNKVEVAIPRAAIGETGGENDKIAILNLNEDPTAGWNADITPNDIGVVRNVYNYGAPIGDVTAVDERHSVRPADFTLSQNYPNPFNPSTTINYTLNKAQKLNISVYNVLGQKVAELYNSTQKAGAHQAVWNGRTLSGSMAPSGVYFYRVQGEKQVKVKKMVLAK